MQSFKDSKNRDWHVQINVQLAKNVKQQTEPPVNIYGLVADGYSPLAELLGDPCALVSVLYVLCQKQCESLSMTPEQFGEMFEGDIITQAGEAFTNALIDFFPDAAVRGALKKLINRSKEMNTEIVQMATTEAEAAMDEMDIKKEAAIIYKSMKAKAAVSAPSELPNESSESSGTAQESSESTQDNSRLVA